MQRRRKGEIRRRKPTRIPKIRFTLFCEGRKMEPEYFRALKNLYSGSLVSIGDKGRSPITLARKALEFVESNGATGRGGRRRNHFEERDEVWVVFDRDEHARFDEAVSLCKANRIGVARSNPCFEVWLILHMADYDRQDERARVKREFARLCSGHDQELARNASFEELMAGVECAEVRSEKLNQKREDEGQAYGRPSTTVGELTKAIRKASNQVGGS